MASSRVGHRRRPIGVSSKRWQLSEAGDVPRRGQLFNVFRVRDGRIVEVTDYARRAEALAAAGARAPEWH